MRLILLITALFFTANWMWDIGKNAENNSGILTNGIWISNATIVWHLAWYATIFSFLALAIYAVQLKERLLLLEGKKYV